jgi:CheY-like chemotaxis protein
MTQANPVTILIVEDEALVRLELADWIEERGLIALSAADADEAMALFEDHREIRLVLTDIKMPGVMDGVRLAHHVKRRWPPVRIVVMSGMTETGACELPRGSMFVPKPFEHDALWATMVRLMTVNTPGGPAGRTA